MIGLLDQQVRIQRRVVTGHDSTNDELSTFATVARINASVQPVNQSELVVGRDTAVGDWNIFLPAGTEVEAYDRIRWGEMIFEVIGPPVEWTALAGPDYVQAVGRWVEG